MTIKESLELGRRIASHDSLNASEDVLQAIRDSVSDPTGLRPIMYEHLEQTDALNEQIEQLQTALQDQIKLFEEERTLRIRADEEAHNFALKWNRINLIVAIAGVLFGLAGFIVALVAL